ncbi:MAG: MFS transporter [Clostridia bacterium]|nr:MFS transporter [Clostridia bacterium]
MSENNSKFSKDKVVKTVFGAEENSAATLSKKKLSKYSDTAIRMFHTRVLSPKELLFPAIGEFAQQMITALEQYRLLYFVNVLRIDMVYVVFMHLLIGIYDVLNNPIMGAIYDRTRTRWGKSRPWIVFTAVPYFLSTVGLYSGALFFGDAAGNDSKKIIFLFSMMFIQETFATMYGIPRGNLVTLQTCNPKDRINVGLFQQYIGNSGAQSIFIIFLPLMELSNKGYINASLSMLFFAIASAAGIIGCIGNISMAIVCKERIILQQKPAPLHKAFFYMLKNKHLLRVYIFEFIFSFWSDGGYKWDVVTQQEIFGGSIPTFIAYLPYNILDVASIGLIPKVTKLFKNNTRNAFIALRIWDLSISIINVILCCSFMDQKNRWLIIGIYAFFYGLNGLNNGPANVFSKELGREITDYTEYVTGERPDGTINVLYQLIVKLTAPLNSLLTIFLFKWSGYDTTITMLPWSQGSKIIYQKVFFLFVGVTLFPQAIKCIPYLFYDIVGDKREKMYIELNARRALLAADAKSEDESFAEAMAESMAEA